MERIEFLLSLEKVNCTKCEKLCNPSAWTTLFVKNSFLPFCSVRCMKYFAKPHVEIYETNGNNKTFI